ncbi:MAG: hypothetical protein JXM71_10645, partial [Spirochaetales bacterium]|nr:hypothetical protein [Spirochaetales bacterium]
DNKNVTERWIEGVLDSDDGDGYLEYLKQSLGTTYSWFVDINSMNIPDGPIELHYIAYDSSGNALHGQTPVSSDTGHYTVQNNGPRIAAIELGTDLDGDGTTDGVGETAQFDYSSATAETESIVAAFTVKDGPMTLKPIVTNGNGDLRVWMSGAYAVNDFAFRTSGVTIPISVDDAALLSMGEGQKSFTIEVWDSTEELTPGVDSLKLTRGITATIDVVDEVAPYAAIRAPYWNGASDNSVYLSSATNGHVDIASNATNGTDDPDVSGKVSIRGVAFDDQRIDAIYLYIGNGLNDTDRFVFTGAASKIFGSLTYARVATYSAGAWAYTNDFATNGWQFAVTTNDFSQDGHRVGWQLDWDSARLPGGAALDRSIRIAVEDKGGSPNASATSTSTLTGTAARANVLTLNDATLIGQGTVSGMAIALKAPGTQESFCTRVQAYDDTSGTITLVDAVATDKTNYTIYLDDHNDPEYQIDVVPYITDISRKAPFIDRLSHLSGKEGWYPVYQGQTGVEISGFNLPYATATTITGNGTIAVGATMFGTAAPDISAALSDRTRVTVTIPAALLSGAVVVTTNTVPSINNLNSGTLDYNDEGSFTDDRTMYIDDISPSVYIAPFGRRYTSSTTDTGKVLDVVDDYNENIVMVDGPDTDPDLDTRAGHVEYSQFSTFSAISVAITPATDVLSATAHGLIAGQMVSLRWVTTAPQLAPGTDVEATDLFYVISDGLGLNAFKLSTTPGGASADFVTAGTTVTVVDPEVSGQVIFRGKAYDDQRIERITMTIAGFDGGGGVGLPFNVYTSTTNASGVTAGTALAGTGWDFDIDGSDQVIDSTRITSGHVVNWAFSWDSSLISTVAAANVLITMTVYDYNDTAHSASM